MRKIEREMLRAFNNNCAFKKDNTEVKILSGVTCVFLHGNLICTKDRSEVKIYDSGWQTATTKSRLVALLDGRGGVFQKKNIWYFRGRSGQVSKFTSGMVAYKNDEQHAEPVAL